MKIKPETLKQGAALMFGAVALAAYLTTVLWPSRPQSITTVSGPGASGDMVQVYLLDEDATLIPYTLGIEENLDLNQKIAEVLRLMTIGNEPVQGVRGLLPNNAQLESCSLQGSQLSLYFPENFRNYDPKTEMRLLEGVTWAVTQFDEVSEVLLYLAGEPLTHMPQLSTPVPMPLNRQIGINNFENTVNRLHDSHSLTVFYTRQKNGMSVYVPKTLRISNQTSLQDTLSSILPDISVFSQLKQPLAQTPIAVLDCSLDADLLTINVNGEILDEEKKVNEELVTSLLLSIQSSLGVSRVELQVDGVTVNLSGVNDDPIDLNSLILNQILL